MLNNHTILIKDNADPAPTRHNAVEKTWERTMVQSDIDHCLSRIAEEERLAEKAPSGEAAQPHLQLVMLYRAQLKMLLRRQPSSDVA